MKFFVPATVDDVEAQVVWDATRRFAEDSLGWVVSERRIFSIGFQHEGKSYHAEVGKPDPHVGETVIAILESNSYLVCTQNRGVVKGMPILVGRDDQNEVTEFQA